MSQSYRSLCLDLVLDVLPMICCAGRRLNKYGCFGIVQELKKNLIGRLTFAREAIGQH